jgi:hypothetical protein
VKSEGEKAMTCVARSVANQGVIHASMTLRLSRLKLLVECAIGNFFAAYAHLLRSPPNLQERTHVWMRWRRTDVIAPMAPRIKVHVAGSGTVWDSASDG